MKTYEDGFAEGFERGFKAGKAVIFEDSNLRLEIIKRQDEMFKRHDSTGTPFIDTSKVMCKDFPSYLDSPKR